MNRKILFTIGILVIAVVLLGGCIQRPKPATTSTTTPITTTTITTPPSSTETICADGIDNDGDGLIDNEDGDCWIREGIIEFSNWKPDVGQSWGPVATWKDYTEWVPHVADIGIKAIYIQAPFEHLTEEEDGEDDPWNIKDYYAFNSQKGTLEDFREFIDISHQHGLKVVFQLVVSGVKPGSYIYDNHQDWILHDTYGELAVVWIGGGIHPGWGYACDRANNDLINFVTNVTRYWIREHDIDGFYLDSLQALYCTEEMEDILGCNCEQPVVGEHNSMEYARRVREAILTEKSGAIVIGEESFKGHIYRPKEYWEEHECKMELISIPPEDICDFYPNDLDRYLMCSLGSIGPSFSGSILKYIIIPSFMGTPISKDSKDLVNWFNQNTDCIMYNGNRARYISTLTAPRMSLVTSDLYGPTITLMTTVPGIVWLHSHEFRYTANAVSLYKRHVSIRNSNNALKYGSIENVWKYGDNTYAYLREYGDEKVVVVINFLDKTATSYLDLFFLPKGTVLYDELNNEKFTVTEPDNFKISVPRYGSRILTLRRDM